MTDAAQNQYYPNTESLADINGKPFKYVYRGKGFNNKRHLHEIMVKEFLKDKAGKIDILVDRSVYKIADVYPDKSEEQLQRLVNLGFYNMTLSSIHHSLEELNEQLEIGHTVKIVTYTMPFGKPQTVDGFYVSSKDFTDKAKDIIGDKLDYDVDSIGEDGSLKIIAIESPEETDISSLLKGQISTDPLA